MSQSYIKNIKKEKYQITYELIDTDLTVNELIQDPEIKEILEQTDFYWFSDDSDTGKVSDFWIAVHEPRVVDEASCFLQLISSLFRSSIALFCRNQ